MGHGLYSSTEYKEKGDMLKAAGKPIFSKHAEAVAKNDYSVHQSLSTYGVNMRESRDSENHPESVAIAVVMDVTGSMRTLPVTMQKLLPGLMDYLINNKVLAHPQIMFGAVGDAFSDLAPLQMGQFESAADELHTEFENMILEGQGGPFGRESYELPLYFLARHTVTDCWEKRQHKGYVFIIGDEDCYEEVSRSHIKKLINDGLQSNEKTSAIIKELQKRYHVCLFRPAGSSGYDNKDIQNNWQELLGAKNVVQLKDINNITKEIAKYITNKEIEAGKVSGDKFTEVELDVTI